MELETTLFYVGLLILNGIAAFYTLKYYNRRLMLEAEKVSLEARRTEIEGEKLRWRQNEK